MNTSAKVSNLQRDMRSQKHNITTLNSNVTQLVVEHRKLEKRVTEIESIFIDKLQEIFEGEDSPLSEIEERLSKLENGEN